MSVVRAAVLSRVGAPVRVEDIELPEPQADQVRVRLAATGVCHSDLSLARGALSQRVPAVLGHEGAGTVVGMGPGVAGVGIGDRVLLNWAPPCRHCWFCLHGEPHLCEHAADAATSPYAYRLGGEPLYPGLGTAAFAEETVVPAAAVVPLPDDISLEDGALLGCAVLTGVGAVLKTSGVRPGESVLVIGLGGVGLSAVQGARIAGANPILAIDTDPGKADLARRLGATDVLAPGPDTAAQVRELTGGRGVDHAFECVGRADTLRSAWSLTRRGGHTVLVGIGAKDDRISFSSLELFHFARTLVSSVYGSTDAATDVPRLVEHVRGGRLDLAGLVTDRVGLDDVEDAFARMGSGRGARTLVLFG